MKLTVTAGVALILGLALFGWYERHQGVQQAEARAHADSLLQADSLKIAQIALQDSVRSRVAQDSLQRLNVEIRTTKHRVSQAQVRGDSLAQAIAGDSVVPRDTVQALIGAFQAERAASAQTLSQVEAENALLTRTLAGKDSTIAALETSLAQMRGQLRAALAPRNPGLLSRALDLTTKAFALYGAARLLGH